MDDDLSWVLSNELSDNQIYVYTLDFPQEIEQEESLNTVGILDVQSLEGWEVTPMLQPDLAPGRPAQTTLPPFAPLLTAPGPTAPAVLYAPPAILGATGKHQIFQINSKNEKYLPYCCVSYTSPPTIFEISAVLG